MSVFQGLDVFMAPNFTSSQHAIAGSSYVVHVDMRADQLVAGEPGSLVPFRKEDAVMKQLSDPTDGSAAGDVTDNSDLHVDCCISDVVGLLLYLLPLCYDLHTPAYDTRRHEEGS
jgi:hypothetical protein